MNAASGYSDGPGRRFLLAALFVLLVGAAIAAVRLRRQPRGPELLNRPTRAREVRPFTTQRDPRFDPLPFEREKHGR
jgi:hypothetical protein